MGLWTMTDSAAGKPKNLSSAEKAVTFGIDATEAAVTANKAKGINTPGWVKYTTYTDAQGATRHKAEVLVAAGSMGGDNDTIDPDPVVTIGTQPLAASVTSPASATFTVAATATRGATPTYQWSYSPDAGATFIDINGATSASLTVVSTESWYVTTNQFRVIVGAPGATSVTSNAVTLTIA